jgi:hypothetical protein
MNKPPPAPPASQPASPSVSGRPGLGQDSGLAAADEPDTAAIRPEASADAGATEQAEQAAGPANPEKPGEASDDDEYVPL